MQRTGEKWHAAVAKSTFASENGKKLTVSEHFLKFRCRKIARRCGAKHSCKSKCTKHHIRGAILEVPMFKNGTRLWREAHLQVENAQNTSLSELFWKFRCSKMPRGCGGEAHLQVKMHKTPHCRSYFGSSDVQKWHAAVARSTF